MIVIDAGSLIAIIDEGEADHKSCVSALANLSGSLVSTWPAVTEAMYLLGSAGAWMAQDALWKLCLRGDLQLVDMDGPLRKRAHALMQKYQDVPMDLADASLVALAEGLNVKQIFTLDKDFYIYPFKGRHAFEIVP